MLTSDAFHPGKKEDKWFFALQPSPAALEAIVRCQDEAESRHGLHRYRLTPANLHVSLHGLGLGSALAETPLQAANQAAASLAFRPFVVTFDRARSFEHHGNR